VDFVSLYRRLDPALFQELDDGMMESLPCSKEESCCNNSTIFSNDFNCERMSSNCVSFCKQFAHIVTLFISEFDENGRERSETTQTSASIFDDYCECRIVTSQPSGLPLSTSLIVSKV
jgi:hypothetical protein